MTDLSALKTEEIVAELRDLVRDRAALVVSETPTPNIDARISLIAVELAKRTLPQGAVMMDELIERARGLHQKLARSHSSLERGQVWCTKCGAARKVDSVDCMRSGWPKCCGYTMTIDSPAERSAMSRQRLSDLGVEE